MGGDDLTTVRDDDVFLVESKDSERISESELVQSFDGWDEGLGKHDHLRIISGTKNFLELRHTGDEDNFRED